MSNLTVLLIVMVSGIVSYFIGVYTGAKIARKQKAFDKEFDAMKKRINKRRELDGKATKYEVDLAAKEGRGGWTGKVTKKQLLDLKLNEPHPFYSKEADDEQRNG